MHIRLLLTLILSTSLLGACVTNYAPNDLTIREVPNVANSQPGRLDYISVVYDTGDSRISAATLNVVSGPRFAPIFRAALDDAVKKSLIFNQTTDRVFIMDAKIVKDKHLKYKSDREFAVNYVIRDRSTGKVVFDEVLESLGQVPSDFSLIMQNKMKEAEDRAARQNLRDFLVKLSLADLSNK